MKKLNLDLKTQAVYRIPPFLGILFVLDDEGIVTLFVKDFFRSLFINGGIYNLDPLVFLKLHLLVYIFHVLTWKRLNGVHGKDNGDDYEAVAKNQSCNEKTLSRLHPAPPCADF
ncbi:MAG TPA: hypothetical protein VKF36_22615 [Syntrophorhabdales bacterium]|nr:hypothetical protein [Syntrophorhabdales bacterium]